MHRLLSGLVCFIDVQIIVLLHQVFIIVIIIVGFVSTYKDDQQTLQ